VREVNPKLLIALLVLAVCALALGRVLVLSTLAAVEAVARQARLRS
jgi:hypothetical protein